MKILVYTTAVNNPNRAIEDTSMIDLTYKSWEYWCKKNNCDFHIIDKPKLNNCKTLTICNSKECIPENIFDNLLSSVEITIDKKNKKSKVKATRKKNKMKR